MSRVYSPFSAIPRFLPNSHRCRPTGGPRFAAALPGKPVAVRRTVLLMVLLAGLAACSDGLRTNPAFTGRTVGVSGDGRQSATLSVVSGANTVTIRSADLGGQLVRAWTPDGSDMFPAANV